MRRAGVLVDMDRRERLIVRREVRGAPCDSTGPGVVSGCLHAGRDVGLIDVRGILSEHGNDGHVGYNYHSGISKPRKCEKTLALKVRPHIGAESPALIRYWQGGGRARGDRGSWRWPGR